MKIGLILFGTGLIGFLIGGAGIDGPTSIVCVILAVVSFVVAAVGHRIYSISERSEEDQTTEEIDAQPKESTFQVWLESGKLDVPF